MKLSFSPISRLSPSDSTVIAERQHGCRDEKPQAQAQAQVLEPELRPGEEGKIDDGFEMLERDFDNDFDVIGEESDGDFQVIGKQPDGGLKIHENDSDDDFDLLEDHSGDDFDLVSCESSENDQVCPPRIFFRPHEFTDDLKDNVDAIVRGVNRAGCWDAIYSMVQRYQETGAIVYHANCVACATAVDMNLEMLANARRPAECKIFYFTNAPDASQFQYEFAEATCLDKSTVEILRGRVKPGQRAIFSTPSGPHYTHCMNYLRQSDGREFVLDGQAGKIHDLQDQAVLRKFLAAYSSKDGIVRGRVTGCSPAFRAAF